MHLLEGVWLSHLVLKIKIAALKLGDQLVKLPPCFLVHFTRVFRLAHVWPIPIELEEKIPQSVDSSLLVLVQDHISLVNVRVTSYDVDNVARAKGLSDFSEKIAVNFGS